MSSLLSDFLTALEVPHTTAYADASFAAMPFKSLFGFARQLKAYGVDSVAARWTDKDRLSTIPVPFLAQVGGAFVIVKDISPDGMVSIRCRHKGDTVIPLSQLEDKWSGVALLAYPAATAAEPDLAAHRFTIITGVAKRWALAICMAVLLVAGALSSRLVESAGGVALLLVNLAGIAVTWLLILKTLKVASHSADRICGIMKEHGCDTVLEQKASSFFGIFSWSEVGLSYFSVSTLALMIFPQSAGWLAIANLCCLPFTFWSIWYQHFRLHTWCTLCVTTQGLLWLQAGSYLWAGAWHHSLAPGYMAPVLLAAYGAALLGLNRLVTFIKHRSGESPASTGQK